MGKACYAKRNRDPTARRGMHLQIVAILLSQLLIYGCGGEPSTSGWKGGLVGVWPALGAEKGKLVLHQGHQAWDNSMSAVAERFQAAGYTVAGFEMPMTPHDDLPTEAFIGPVTRWIDNNSNGSPVVMVGLSGGGWTTTVTTALDARITRGYSVAGDIPEDMRITRHDKGDWEQVHPPFPYREMYSMAGDRLMHIYIWDDPCCFTHVSGDIGAPYVIDYTTVEHEISEWTVNFILDDLLYP